MFYWITGFVPRVCSFAFGLHSSVMKNSLTAVIFCPLLVGMTAHTRITSHRPHITKQRLLVLEQFSGGKQKQSQCVKTCEWKKEYKKKKTCIYNKQRDGRWCRPLPLSHTLCTLTHSSLWPTMASLNVLQLNGYITGHISKCTPSHTKARGSTVSEFILKSARMIASKNTDGEKKKKKAGCRLLDLSSFT